MEYNEPRVPVRTTGRFSYDPATGKWDWDDEVFRIHGFKPGSVEPTTDLVLASKHPDDRERFAAMLARVSETGEPFSTSYRIVAADGVERRVVLVGQSEMCEPDENGRIEGYYADLSADFDEESGEAADAAVLASAGSRATIEQAKGALMMAYGLEPDAAFAMLRWWSRNRNVKVREIAERLVGAARGGGGTNADLRGEIDVMLHDLTT